jgi:hypothetical protein
VKNGNGTVEKVRPACVEAALSASQDAGLRGLCAGGRWESAITAVRGLDLEQFVEHRVFGGTPIRASKRDSSQVSDS